MNPEGFWLAERWAEQLSAAIGSMTGAEAKVSLLDAGPPFTPEPGDLTWFQPFSAAPHAALCLVVGASVWKGLGGRVLEAAGLESADETEIRGTFLEILQQSLSPLATAMAARLGKEVACQDGELASSAPPDLQWHGAEVSLAGETLGRVWLAGNSVLLDVLAPQQSAPPPANSRAVDADRKAPATMDLLLEVELPVGVSFGRAQMKLKDAIKLTTGSIVELNRSINEPVEILVNNCVIARGEVVVVEGNYGIRIKQIVSREERLRTLF